MGMSMKVLKAILGDEVVEQMSLGEVSALAQELDAEILKDAALTDRLSKVVRNAAHRSAQVTTE
jgi:hypothetical protein